ncbi:MULTISPECIES: TlpA family protein disulfide reductase [Corallincola]|uniref:TlpA family protein disulfide reductase n=3 Tax=Corallincola TaxID=1775176 RepID=A0A368NHK1_9GAMM|nr:MULTISPECIES: TlpA disulfide reductase family protein [Corallincola]RCU50042.1 TlpA family protein disulfide reductase [Corallincola holothuriorum]TAA44976.1 TlpA family protein disulfide reductase [Corallincola spongiicola]TCI03764.1 TlpA family protein disulfide reductase [Corallincola luteus]
MRAFFISLLLSATFVFSGAAYSAELKIPAPDFTLKSSTGENIRLSELRGEIVLLNFWASWCGPCRQEMPELEALATDFADLGVKVLGVNVEQDPSEGMAFLKDITVSFPILFDKTNEVTELYDVDSMPTTVLIDRDGQIRFHHRGYKPGYEDTYRQQIKSLIRE